MPSVGGAAPCRRLAAAVKLCCWSLAQFGKVGLGPEVLKTSQSGQDPSNSGLETRAPTVERLTGCNAVRSFSRQHAQEKKKAHWMSQ